MSASQGSGSVGATVLAAQHLPETILRIRGSYSACLEGAQTGGQGVSLHMGLILVPEGTGTTILWTPDTDGDAPWIWWDVRTFFYEEYVTDVIVSSNVTDFMGVIDSKAMRHVRNTELQFVAQNQTVSGFSAASINVSGDVWVLAGS